MEVTAMSAERASRRARQPGEDGFSCKPCAEQRLVYCALIADT
ncbi:hypothetical protein [Streptomyces sp. NPDC005573]